MSTLIEKIEQDISPLVNDLECIVVRVAFLGNAKNKVLQIMIEKASGEAATIGDCEKVSKAVSTILDVSDLVGGRYSLEVSSAGVNRPLTKPADFFRFCGKPVVIKTYALKNDRKVFKGNLESASEDGIRLILDAPLSNGDNIVDFIFKEISSAYVDGFKI
ncbi:MAG: ribosome maturation factor RimP [Holosporales bacterium]|jgi:ribosome maturation factor RimP|nr:ribosome maturation factor RimP [Holosporales bacterium]